MPVTKLLFRWQRHLAQTEGRKRAGSQLGLVPNRSFEKLAKGPLTRLIGRIAHQVWLQPETSSEQPLLDAMYSFEKSEKTE